MEYYQVAYTAKEEATLTRELNPLKKIKDNYRKFLLTTDEFEWISLLASPIGSKKFIASQ